jgi:hypothetical protein
MRPATPAAGVGARVGAGPGVAGVAEEEGVAGPAVGADAGVDVAEAVVRGATADEADAALADSSTGITINETRPSGPIRRCWISPAAGWTGDD